jgi:hypothetical protein
MEVIDAVVASGCSGVWVQPDGGTSELAGARAGRNAGTGAINEEHFLAH